MAERHAPSNAQAYARAMQLAFGFSNARTYVRNLQRTTHLYLETYVSNAHRGA